MAQRFIGYKWPLSVSATDGWCVVEPLIAAGPPLSLSPFLFPLRTTKDIPSHSAVLHYPPALSAALACTCKQAAAARLFPQNKRERESPRSTRPAPHPTPGDNQSRAGYYATLHCGPSTTRGVTPQPRDVCPHPHGAPHPLRRAWRRPSWRAPRGATRQRGTPCACAWRRTG